jgi:hypothetical protein
LCLDVVADVVAGVSSGWLETFVPIEPVSVTVSGFVVPVDAALVSAGWRF